jgi:hypothetical protein
MSKDKRRSIFGRSSLTALTSIQSTKDDSQPSNLLRKRRTASFMSNMSNLSDASQSTEKQSLDTASEAPASPKPTLSRGSLKRASSVFGSIRGYRLPTEDDEPLSATSTRASTGFGEYLGEDVRDRQVLQYGEVQTSSSMFRKKREYLVLTEKHLIRFKTHAKAAEAFPSIPSPFSSRFQTSAADDDGLVVCDCVDGWGDVKVHRGSTDAAGGAARGGAS